MQLFDNIRLAFGSLWANKLRALLTMLGIIIGIGSVIAIVTLGDSLTGSITDSLQGFGINNITVSLQQKTEDDETSGGAVVCEEMCTGTRYFEKQVDESGQTIDEEIQALANRYMNINCACFTPNTGRIDDILRLAKEYKVDGIIDINLKFCNLYDTEGYLVEKAMNEAGIPVLGIETDYTDSDAQQLRTRISAFIEMLNN